MSRYIDADKAIKELHKRITCLGQPVPSGFFRGTIDAVPTADVVEVRHGRWVDRTQEPGWPVAECSVCGSHAGMFWMDYCPNCGAKMDGESDE